ncbi:MAG: MFS transporter [Brachymonas sp.]|nr:MFS transporter [Brachymonas sp.]
MKDASTPIAHNQFALLGQRRFAPFFTSQFFGAANDNLMKFALTVMVTYQMQLDWLPPAQAGLVISAVFIAPFLIFSATSGQLTDKYPKDRIIRFAKLFELLITLVAFWGFYIVSVPVLLACVFLMGVQSTLFGPVKYALLPQVLHEKELTGGNGLVETGTFVAILLGNFAGGVLMALPNVGRMSVAVACVVLALIGYVAARAVPPAPAMSPDLRINPNPVSETWRNLQIARRYPAVFRSLLGISWMWFVGAMFLSQFPSLAKDVLHGDEQVASLLLVMFSFGIGVGSLLCEKLSRNNVEIGLVPIGALGMTLAMADLYFALRGVQRLPAPAEYYSLGAFFQLHTHWRVLADLFVLAMSAGIFSVPMYALVQLRCPPQYRARIIASNNILGSVFMIASAILAGLLIGAGWSIARIILLLALLNVGVCIYLFTLVPEYLLRLVAWVLTYCIYRFKVRGDHHIPQEGAAIVASNHVSFADAVLLLSASPRPIYFLMDYRIFRAPVLGLLFRATRAIPVCSPKENAAVYEAAMQRAVQVLREGDLLGIFPEGRLTTDGTLGEFKHGIRKILDEEPVPVVPMALQNLWGSFFSRVEGGKAMSAPFRRGFFSRVGLNIGQPLSPDGLTPESLRVEVEKLLQDKIV